MWLNSISIGLLHLAAIAARRVALLSLPAFPTVPLFPLCLFPALFFFFLLCHKLFKRKHHQQAAPAKHRAGQTRQDMRRSDVLSHYQRTHSLHIYAIYISLSIGQTCPAQTRRMTCRGGTGGADVRARRRRVA